MAVGENSGNQLNLLVFEIGMVTNNLHTGEQTHETLTLHPLAVGAKSIRYTDQSRSSVDKTSSSALLTRGGRALRTLSLQGSFGVEERGIGPFSGTGEVRFQRFWQEAVRLPDSVNLEQVLDAVGVGAAPFLESLPTVTKFLRERVGTYDPDTTQFYINFWDFWNGVQFEALIRSFVPEKTHGRGAAQGETHYTMLIEEVGPIVVGGLSTNALQGMQDGVAMWNESNAIIEQYDPASVLANASPVMNIAMGNFTEALDKVSSQLDSASSLVGVSRNSDAYDTFDTVGLGDFFDNVLAMVTAADEVKNTLAKSAAKIIDAPPGLVPWDKLYERGSSPAYEDFEAMADLDDVLVEGEFQHAAGAFGFGMSEETFQQFVSSAGQTGTQDAGVAGTIEYTTHPEDDVESLEAAFGVSFELILAVNGMTPDEALFPGTPLNIPRARRRGPVAIDGLPVFDSHQGRKAWGSDIDLNIKVDPTTGEIAVVKETAALVQGIDILVEEFAEQLLAGTDHLTPATIDKYVAHRVRTIIESDARIAGVQEVSIDDSTGTGLSITVTASAINGGTIQTGGAS